MRLVFICPRFHTNQRDFVHALTAGENEVSFIVVGESKSEDHSVITPICVKGTKLGRLLNKKLNPSNDFGRSVRYVTPSIRGLFRILDRMNPEAAVLRLDSLPLVLSSIPWLLLKRRQIVLYSQGPKFRNRISALRKLQLWIVLRLFKWRWMTPVERYIEGDRIDNREIDTGIDYIPFAKKACQSCRQRTYNTKNIRILTIGKFMPRKNHLNVIRAFAKVRVNHQCRLTIIGENSRPEHRDYLKKIIAEIKTLQIGESVTIRENLSYDQVQKEYEKHDLFVLASHSEPASISQLEAMSHALAVICGRENGTAGYVADGDNGILIDNTVEGLENALSMILSQPHRVAEMGKRSWEMVQNHHDPEAIANKFLCLVEPKHIERPS